MARGLARPPVAGRRLEMSVYVDDMREGYRGMIMCHMAADTHK